MFTVFVKLGFYCIHKGSCFCCVRICYTMWSLQWRVACNLFKFCWVLSEIIDLVVCLVFHSVICWAIHCPDPNSLFYRAFTIPNVTVCGAFSHLKISFSSSIFFKPTPIHWDYWEELQNVSLNSTQKRIFSNVFLEVKIALRNGFLQYWPYNTTVL